MSSISQWISENYDILKLKTIGINVKEPDDVFQEVIIQFLEMDTGKTSMLINNNEASKYIMAMYKVNCFSKTSPYQRTYNKYKYINYDETLHSWDQHSSDVICLKEFDFYMDQLDIFFVDKAVYRDYVHKKIKIKSYSINKASQETTIPRPSLEVKFKNIRNELKKIKKEYEKRRSDEKS